MVVAENLFPEERVFPEEMTNIGDLDQGVPRAGAAAADREVAANARESGQRVMLQNFLVGGVLVVQKRSQRLACHQVGHGRSDYASFFGRCLADSVSTVPFGPKGDGYRFAELRPPLSLQV